MPFSAPFRRALVALLTSLMLAGCGQAVVNMMAERGPDRTDLRYRSGERGTYDLYGETSAGAGAPLVIFFYGGSWDSGAKGDYRFVGSALAERGYLVAIPDYRLYPAVRYPGFVEDGAEAVAAIAKRHGEGRAVVVAGHSAGAQIGAMIAYDDRWLRAAGAERCATVTGFVGLAGPYDFLPLTDATLKLIFAPSLREDAQPARYGGGADPRSLLIHGDGDTTVHAEDTRIMAAALRQSGSAVETRIYPGVDHTDLVGALAPVVRDRAPTLADMGRFIDALPAGPGGTCAGG